MSHIDRAAEGRTVTRQFVETSRGRSSDPALHRKVGEEWTTLSWGEYADRAARIATGLRNLGVRVAARWRGAHADQKLKRRGVHARYAEEIESMY